MAWDNVESAAAQLKQRLANDDFGLQVLDGALRVARDDKNPLRGNLFATPIRELISHVLHKLAPDDRVKTCAWFKEVPGANGPTRKQRAAYIVQGGLLDDFVSDELGFDPDELHGELLDAIDELNKRVHVREGTVMANEDDVVDLVESTLHAFLGLFENADACRDSIETELGQHVDREVMDKLISETIDDLDILSTHTTIEGHQLETVDVTRLDQGFVEYEVSGTVFVQLQYGSNSDVGNDIGAKMSDSYPYTATMRSSVTAPTAILTDSIDVKVDTSSFYE